MAYKSLYRLYRPQRFEEVAGQRFIVQTLKNAIELNKTAHAYLFTGPRGTGKTSIAKILAKAINCVGDIKPCNVCPNCLAALKNTHPDIIEIDAASNNGVDEIRDLIDRVKYAPLMGTKKIYIVDEVHMLSTGAFNAFLKTLEEPPEHVIFILATTEPHKIIATILSRCQRFDFNKISNDDIKMRLAKILDEEKIAFDNDVISLIAELSDGGMRDALTIADQTIAFAGNKISVNDVNEIYGILSNKEKLEFIKLLCEGDISAALTAVNEFNNRGIDIIRLSYDLVTILKDVAVSALAKNNLTPLSLSQEEVNFLREHISLTQALEYIEIIQDAPRSGGAKSMLELIVLKIISKNSNNTENKTFRPQPTFNGDKKTEKIYENNSLKIDKTSNNTNKEEKEESELSNPEVVVLSNEEKTVSNNETLNEKNLEYKIPEANFLNVLVQANKELKTKIAANWSKINHYINDPKFNYPALILIDAKVFAVCPEAIIITYRREVQLITALRKDMYSQLSDFLIELTGTKFIIYPMLESESENLIKKFLELRKENKLPAPTKITPIDQETEKSKDLNSIFGNYIKEK